MKTATQEVKNATFDSTKPEVQLNQVFANMVQAWNRHDVKTYVATFAEDCDFVNAIGRHLRSRAELENELNWLHGSIFRNSELRIRETHVRFAGSNIAICPLHWTMRGHEGLPGHPYPETRTGVFTLVLRRDEDRWSVIAAQNTDFVELPGL